MPDNRPKEIGPSNIMLIRLKDIEAARDRQAGAERLRQRVLDRRGVNDAVYDPEREGCPVCGDLDAIGGALCGECAAQREGHQ